MFPTSCAALVLVVATSTAGGMRSVMGDESTGVGGGAGGVVEAGVGVTEADGMAKEVVEGCSVRRDERDFIFIRLSGCESDTGLRRCMCADNCETCCGGETRVMVRIDGDTVELESGRDGAVCVSRDVC